MTIPLSRLRPVIAKDSGTIRIKGVDLIARLLCFEATNPCQSAVGSEIVRAPSTFKGTPLRMWLVMPEGEVMAEQGVQTRGTKIEGSQ